MNRYRSYYYFAISIALTICMTYLRCFFFYKMCTLQSNP